MASQHLEREETPERVAKESNGGNLSRQVTVQLNPEDYERLFFQPNPARGDLSKRLGMPCTS